MGFCTEEQSKAFLQILPTFEKMMVDSGIILLKYWLEVSPDEQTRDWRTGSTTAERYGNSPHGRRFLRPMGRIHTGT